MLKNVETTLTMESESEIQNDSIRISFISVWTVTDVENFGTTLGHDVASSQVKFCSVMHTYVT